VTTHHLYVHVPFCRLVCAYCDFVTVGGRRAELPRYVDALLAEMTMRPAGGDLETVYFGGGTPSLLPVSAIERVLRTAMDRWGGLPTEITLEANPSQREASDWSGLRLAGVNRISLGLQSLHDGALRTLARGHTAAEARRAFSSARIAGFDNVSIDLIYGIPGQSRADWRSGLRAAIALEPEHLSLYALQLAMAPDEWAAPPRPGALRWRRRLAARQQDDLVADQYSLGEDLLDAAGYHHYELSSWARTGRESRHNAAYWARRAYTGIGAGAHSYDGEATRSWNTGDLDRYLVDVEAGKRPVSGTEHLSEPSRAFEAIALGLRRVEGTSRRAFAAEFGKDPVHRFAQAVEQGCANGLLEVDDDLLRLTTNGRLLANVALLGFLPEAGTSRPGEPVREAAAAR
jgi:oxygen-independent coproporphyrinogen III oxidase